MPAASIRRAISSWLSWSPEAPWPGGGSSSTRSTPSNTVSYQERPSRLLQLKVWGSNTTTRGRSGKCSCMASMAERAFS